MVRNVSRILALILLLSLAAACGPSGQRTAATAPAGDTGGAATAEAPVAEAPTEAMTEAPVTAEETAIVEETAAMEETALVGETAMMEETATMEETSTSMAGGPIDYGSLSGDVVLDGSSTVEPVALAMAEEFGALAPDVNVAVGRSGTGGGFEKFCNGETDISNASRPVRDEEAEVCATNNVEPVELQVGIDALALVTNADNEFLSCLTTEQMVQIFQEGGATTWDQIDPSFPAEPIEIFAPGADSGTFDYFTEHFGLRGEEEEEPAFVGDYTASEDDNVLVQGIEGSANAIGFFGFAYYQENEGGLKAIEMDDAGDGTCVAPSAETVQDGSYPLARPLFMYPSMAALERPEVQGFLQYALSDEGLALVEEVGYFPAPQDAIEQARQALSGALQ